MATRRARVAVPPRYRSEALARLRRTVRHTALATSVRLGARVTLHGAENVEGLTEPFIVIANHSSHMDTGLVYSVLPDHLTRLLSVGAAADTWFMNPVKSLVPTILFNAYPVDRPGRPHKGDHRGLSDALLDQGIPLMIFPEGTRSRTGAMASFTPGVARLSRSHGVPVVPVALVGSGEAWPANKRMPRWPRREVHVVIGRPMSAREGETSSLFTRRLEREVVDLHDGVATQGGLRSLAVLAARRARRG